MLLNLQQAITNPLACEEWQLRNWLTQLNEYIKKDTEIQVNQLCLSGNFICPHCNEKMALDVKYFCDKCGQRIKI